MDVEASAVALLEPDLPSATPSYLPRPSIEEFAEFVSNEFDLLNFGSEDEPDPLLKLVATLGGTVRYLNPTEFAASESGSIKVYGQNKFDLYLSTFTGPLRDRFTIAHELGHYFVHSRQGELPLRASRKGSGQVEWEANWFAAALLMPGKQFMDAMERHGEDTYAIAGTFRVSTQAVGVRRKRFR